MSWNQQGGHPPPTQNVPEGTMVVGVDEHGRPICRAIPRGEQAHVVHYTQGLGIHMVQQHGQSNASAAGSPSGRGHSNPGGAGGGGAAAGDRQGWYETQDPQGRRYWRHIPTGHVSYQYPGP